jgi:dTDP-4-dehydrorhamnose reductase
MAGRTRDPVLVIGASGMLARAFSALLAREQVAFSSIDVPEIDLTDPSSIERGVGSQFRLVLNCAAWTNVDAAEDREAEATAVNGTGVGALAARCKQTGATLVHYSTDYVFDGEAKEPYAIDHPRAPINAYGRGKLLGEELLERSGARYLLVRTSWLYAPWGTNFVLTMRDVVLKSPERKVVVDQIGRPTSAEYLAQRTLDLVAHECTGTFHVTDGGQCSWHAFASEIARLCRANCRLEPCSSNEFPRRAKRPAYSVLDLGRTEAVLGASTSWQENLAAVLKQVAPAG